ncbi:MAG: TRAP transporter large permease [Pseudomonadota bacterium]
MIAFAFLGLLALLLIGLPIYVGLGGLSVGLLMTHGTPGITLAQIVIDKLNSTTMLAVPFFVIAAQFMERGGIAKVLITMAEAWLGWLRGGLALSCVGATTVFAAISGSSVATALAMATILVPAMLTRGYRRSFALGVVGASGTLGILIPPSIILIIYGLIAEVSIPRLFLAGVIPGLMQAALFSVFIIWYAYRHQLATLPSYGWAGFVRANVQALPACLIPIIIFLGIYGGYTTVAEAAALAAVLAVLISLFVYRGCHWTEILSITGIAIRRSAAIVMIVVGALLFSHWLTETRVPVKLVEMVTAAELTAWQFLLLMNVVMILMGTVLEGLSIILITLPLLLPILAQFRIDLVHYAIIVVINIEIAMLTPPVGLNLFVLSSVSKAPVAEVIRGVLPFLALMLVLLGLVTYLPQLSLYLPDLAFG